MRTGDDRTILQALSLINDCNKYKMDLTTNGVIITEAIKFVRKKMRKNPRNLIMMMVKIKNQLEEKQEEETVEIEQETPNQVF